VTLSKSLSIPFKKSTKKYAKQKNIEYTDQAPGENKDETWVHIEIKSEMD
jgi:hypothetical protein